MEKIEACESAYPHESPVMVPHDEVRGALKKVGTQYHAGLTKRDYFAASALTGMIGSGVITKEGESYREAKVRAAFEYADEMLKQSAQTEKEKS